jgi:RHS repeat-associated protein
MGNAQTIVDHVEYTPFGAVQSESATQGFADRYFNGLIWNYTTGLLHERDRDSNPSTARFLQQDPLGLKGDINLYRDVGNDPANFSDPTGDQRATIGGPGDMPAGDAGGSSQRGAGLSTVDRLAGFFASLGTSLPNPAERVRNNIDASPNGGRVNRRQFYEEIQAWSDAQIAARIAELQGRPEFAPQLDLNRPNMGLMQQEGYLSSMEPTAAGVMLQELRNEQARRRQRAAAALYHEGDMHNPARDLPYPSTPAPDGVATYIPVINMFPALQHAWENGDMFAGAMAVFNGVNDAAFVSAVGRYLVRRGLGLLGEAGTSISRWLGWCFPAGTLVHTNTGLRPIEEVATGDSVWAFDLVTGKWRVCKVLETFCRHYQGRKVAVTASGETVEATYRHPFWVLRGEALETRPRLEHLQEPPAGCTTPGRWVDAGDLRVGDELLLRSGQVSVVERLTVAAFEGPVYNFDVEDIHCFAVGREGALVHNSNGPERAIQPVFDPRLNGGRGGWRDPVSGQITRAPAQGAGAGSQALDQVDSIARAQQRLRDGSDTTGRRIIDSTEGSRQTLRNQLNRPFDPSDWD